MRLATDKDTVEFIWTELNNPIIPSRTAKADKIFDKVFTRGWAFKSDIEDLTDALDPRLDTYRFNVKEISELFDLKWQSVSFKPRPNSYSVAVFDALRIDDLLAFLIHLEQLGFQVDPSRFVAQVLPAIKSRTKLILTESELTLLWYGKHRHKYEPLKLIVEESYDFNEIAKTIKTATGYKVTLITDDDRIIRLQVSAPSYRKSPPIVLMQCPQCGIEWEKGIPESSAYHRKQHKRIMSYLAPEPSPELIAEKSKGNYSEFVDWQSPAWKQKAMYERAQAFKRELNFDFIQWADPSDIPDFSAEGVLFSNEDSAIIGAASFRTKKEGSDWYLDWIWICPNERRKGHLEDQWKKLRSRYGNFRVSHPVSDAMKTFLEKHGEAILM